MEYRDHFEQFETFRKYKEKIFDCLQSKIIRNKIIKCKNIDKYFIDSKNNKINFIYKEKIETYRYRSNHSSVVYYSEVRTSLGSFTIYYKDELLADLFKDKKIPKFIFTEQELSELIDNNEDMQTIKVLLEVLDTDELDDSIRGYSDDYTIKNIIDKILSLINVNKLYKRINEYYSAVELAKFYFNECADDISTYFPINENIIIDYSGDSCRSMRKIEYSSSSYVGNKLLGKEVNKYIDVYKIPDKLYIRFGEIPENGRSKIHHNCSEVIGEEKGVSVYNSVQGQITYYPVLPDKKIDHVVDTYFDFIFGDRKVFLVTGEELPEKGSDGEPLLKDVKIIKELTNYNEWYNHRSSKDVESIVEDN